MIEESSLNFIGQVLNHDESNNFSDQLSDIDIVDKKASTQLLKRIDNLFDDLTIEEALQSPTKHYARDTIHK